MAILISTYFKLLFFLGKAISPSHKGDCKESTSKICAQVFKNNKDYQMGHTKLFLKHADSERLEELRSEVLARYNICLTYFNIFLI